jgi:hypothetical protein
MTLTEPFDHLRRFGYALLRSVFDVREVDSLASRLSVALQANEPSVLRSRGHTYGSRDFLRLLPDVSDIPRHPDLKEFIAAVVGPRAGLERFQLLCSVASTQSYRGFRARFCTVRAG